MRRPQALYPPAFLVDQDGRVVPAHAVAKGGDQIANLPRLPAIAAEQDKAERICVRKERAFVRVERLSRATEDRGGRMRAFSV